MAKFKEVLSDATSCTLGNTPNRSTQCKLCSAQVVVSKAKRFIAEHIGVPESVEVSTFSLNQGEEVTMTLTTDLAVTEAEVKGLDIRSFTLTELTVSDKTVVAKFTADQLDAHKNSEMGVIGIEVNGIKRLAQVKVNRALGVENVEVESPTIAVGGETNINFTIAQ